MAFARLGSVSAGNADTNNVTTAALDTTGAKLLVLVLGAGAATAGVTISDSKGNTWTPLTEYSRAGTLWMRIYYSKPTSVGTGHTFTASSTACYPCVTVTAFSAAGTPTFDAENSASAGTVTTQATGSVSPAVDNEVLVAGAIIWIDRTVDSIDASFTAETATTWFAANAGTMRAAYLIQTTKAAVNPTWTFSGATAHALAVIATFKDAMKTDRMFLVF